MLLCETQDKKKVYRDVGKEIHVKTEIKMRVMHYNFK